MCSHRPLVGQREGGVGEAAREPLLNGGLHGGPHRRHLLHAAPAPAPAPGLDADGGAGAGGGGRGGESPGKGGGVHWGGGEREDRRERRDFGLRVLEISLRTEG
jgi:hypothetical protein